MKIFFIQTASMIDHVINIDIDNYRKLSYKDILIKLSSDKDYVVRKAADESLKKI